MEEIKQELEKMVEVDQAARSETPIDWEKTIKIDRKNTERMKQIIKENGWITTTKFGEEAAHNAWLLVQHADHDVDFQQECLDIMEGLSDDDVSKKDMAYLTDRVMMKKKGLQRYGSQYFVYPDYIMLQPLEDTDNVDTLRKSVGMLTLKEAFADEDKPVYVIIRKLVVEK